MATTTPQPPAPSAYAASPMRISAWEAGECGYTCGDHLISLVDGDPTRWCVIDTTTGERVTEGRVPRLDAGGPHYLYAALIHQFEDQLPTAGLEAWCADAERLAYDAYLDLDADRVKNDLRRRMSLPGRLAANLEAEAGPEVEFLVPGVLVPGWTTKWAAREKVGKGTLAYYVIGRLEQSRDTVFGPGPGHPVTTLVLSEEPPESTSEKVSLFGVERTRIIWGWELEGSWRDKVDRLIDVAVLEGHGLIFIDNISRATCIQDESGTELARAIEYLQDRCRSQNIAAWIDHHHKKGAGPTEDKSRGSTSIAGAADINIDMFRAPGNRQSRERKLVASGRVRATSWTKRIELAEAWNDYVEVDSPEAESTGDGEAKLQHAYMTLAAMVFADVQAFRSKLNVSENTARNRLNDLVNDGRATVDKIRRPALYTVVIPAAASSDQTENASVVG